MKIGIICAAFVCSLSLPVSVYASESANPRFVIHLLDYLAKDYGGAVSEGKIISQSEYDEQIEFSNTVLKTSQEIPEIQSQAGIAGDIKKLNQLISGKADAAEVAALARSIQGRVIQASKVDMSPVQWPSIKRGRELYSQSCVACHGATGAGDGPAGAGLDPKPANFLDPGMSALSPFQAFNTIRLGVPGTGMTAFPHYSDQEVWSLAFYLVSLRHQASARSPQLDPKFISPENLNLVAELSDDKLLDRFKDPLFVASLRRHSNDDEGGSGPLNHAKAQLDEAAKEYRAGNQDNAKAAALMAYLEGIEPVEPRLKATDPSFVAVLETKMAAVRSAIEGKQEPEAVEAAVSAAKLQIDETSKLLTSDQMSPWIAFLAASAIILREGFEAVLVIIALLGVIRAAQAQRAARWVHGGWMAALGVGVVAWFLSGWLMQMSGAQRETLEGATSLFAVAVLLLVGFWLHSQTEIGRWQSFIHGKVQKALEGRNLYGLATIAFVAVFREAFETVLFLRAIWLEGAETSKFALLGGVLSSLALVMFLAWALLKYSSKVPIRRLFTACSVMMLFLAFVLTGKGFHAFQETGALSVTSSQSLIRIDLLGIYPTWETLVLQVAVLVLALILWWVGQRPSQVAVSPARTK